MAATDMAGDHSTSHILQSLIVNFFIASAKGIAAFFTGSGAMLAESIHSAADCGNQLLLLLGVKSSAKPADATHPLGYGRALYFWSFIVALMLFLGGGVFSIYEGIHKMSHPEPVTLLGVALAILIFSLVLEGYATISNIKEINRRRGEKTFFQFLRQTKDSDLVVVFGENLAATLGLIVAIVTLAITWVTGDSRFDGLGSAVIGLLLIVIAVFLAVEVKSLLIGESADAGINEKVRGLLPQHSDVNKLLHLITLQQGPGQVLLMCKLAFRQDISVQHMCDAINRFEDDVREVCPEVRWCFVEPDRPRH